MPVVNIFCGSHYFLHSFPCLDHHILLSPVSSIRINLQVGIKDNNNKKFLRAQLRGIHIILLARLSLFPQQHKRKLRFGRLADG